MLGVHTRLQTVCGGRQIFPCRRSPMGRLGAGRSLHEELLHNI